MSIELWGGIECSRVHVHDRTVDQLELTGHAQRESDIGLFAGLGLDAIRYPLLLNRVAPKGPAYADWSWADQRLSLLRREGIRPVVTLVHHGTRHRGMDIRNPGYAIAVAEYAEAVARRYPWIRDYTPVNEPLTTARFGCLYGYWHPHTTSDSDFYRALANLCLATTMSMQAIRAANPEARLIHTEDLGWTHGTPELAHQSHFENERRRLGIDLLCGRVTEDHPFRRVLLDAGVPEALLDWFLANPCPPDVLGCDYYPTSERVIDQRMELYPDWSHGGNGREQYADVHIDLAPDFEPRGLKQLLLDTAERWRLPLALTEVHLNAPDRDRVQWLDECRQIALELDRDSVQVEAVCTWALLGSFDWNSTMTRQDGHYEPGAFDLRGNGPRITALGRHVRRLASEQS